MLFLALMIHIFTVTYPCVDDVLVLPVRAELPATADHWRIAGLPAILMQRYLAEGRTCYDWPVSSTGVACDWDISDDPAIKPPDELEPGEPAGCISNPGIGTIGWYQVCLGWNIATIVAQPMTSADEPVGDPFTHVWDQCVNEMRFMEWTDYCNVSNLPCMVCANPAQQYDDCVGDRIPNPDINCCDLGEKTYSMTRGG